MSEALAVIAGAIGQLEEALKDIEVGRKGDAQRRVHDVAIEALGDVIRKLRRHGYHYLAEKATAIQLYLLLRGHKTRTTIDSAIKMLKELAEQL